MYDITSGEKRGFKWFLENTKPTDLADICRSLGYDVADNDPRDSTLYPLIFSMMEDIAHLQNEVYRLTQMSQIHTHKEEGVSSH